MTNKKSQLLLIIVLLYMILPIVVVWANTIILGEPFDLTIQSYLAGLVLVIIFS